MKWLRIGFENAMTHAVHASLLPQLVGEMLVRGHEVANFETKYGIDHARVLEGNPKSITDWAFDLGGCCYVNMPRESIAIDGLTIVVDCDTVETVLRIVDKATIRRFASGEWYYKLKFWHHATVLTPKQFDAVQDGLCGRLGYAKRRADEFFARVEEHRAKAASKEQL